MLIETYVTSRQDSLKRSLVKGTNIIPTVLRAAKLTDPIVAFAGGVQEGVLAEEQQRALIAVEQQPQVEDQRALVAVEPVEPQPQPQPQPQLQVAAIAIEEPHALVAAVNNMAKKIDELEAMVKQLQNKPTIVAKINNIHLHNFGEESLAHLLEPESYLRQQLLGVIKMISDTFFHPDHPDNHTVRNRSMKQHLVEVRKDSRWIVQPFDDVANALIGRSIGYVCRNYVPLANDSTNTLVEGLIRKKHHPKLRNNVKALLMNHDARDAPAAADDAPVAPETPEEAAPAAALPA